VKSKAGFVAIIVAFIGSLNPYGLVFTLPIFLIGAAMVFMTDKSKKTKMLWMIIPVLLWYPSMRLFMYGMKEFGKSKAQKIDVVFQEGFKGKAIVLANMPCGQTVELNADREQLFIPANGILSYQGDIKAGYVNHNYYYITKEGNLTPLPKRTDQMVENDRIEQSEKGVIGVWLNGLQTKEEDVEYKYMSLTVSSTDSIDKYKDETYAKKMEQITDSLFLTCKSKSK